MDLTATLFSPSSSLNSQTGFWFLSSSLLHTSPLQLEGSKSCFSLVLHNEISDPELSGICSWGESGEINLLCLFWLKYRDICWTVSYCLLAALKWWQILPLITEYISLFFTCKFYATLTTGVPGGLAAWKMIRTGCVYQPYVLYWWAASVQNFVSFPERFLISIYLYYIK